MLPGKLGTGLLRISSLTDVMTVGAVRLAGVFYAVQASLTQAKKRRPEGRLDAPKLRDNSSEVMSQIHVPSAWTRK